MSKLSVCFIGFFGIKNQHVNKYLRFDPTLRRINDPHITCSNDKCIEENANKQIIYIKYDSKNMKYLYVCDNCGKTWKQVNQN